MRVPNVGWLTPTVTKSKGVQGCSSRGGIWKKLEANARAKVHELDLRQGSQMSHLCITKSEVAKGIPVDSSGCGQKNGALIWGGVRGQGLAARFYSIWGYI
ncbi:hypothetical protein [Paenibacillus polymyxa]|uniref:hypothetical protein n=1 Tax=Paenibacillus polymyxa TaxID=1406 RepID=UPI0010BF4F3F|nr:hypothetical protein [Paenibacillus polymyxa]